MTVKEIKVLINSLSDNVEIEINSFCDENGEWESSPICEMHYCENHNKVYITPNVVSI